MKNMSGLLIYAPSLIFPRAAMFVTTLLAAKWLDGSEYGYLALTFIVSEMCDAILGNWVRVYLNRFGASLCGVSRQFITSTSYAYLVSLIISAFTAAIIVMISDDSIGITYVLATVSYLVSIAASRYSITVNQVQGYRVLSSIFEIIRGITSPVSFLFGIICGLETYTAIILMAICNIVIAIISYVAALKHSSNDEMFSINTHNILKFATPIIIISMLTQIVTAMDKVLLNLYFSKELVGYYYTAFTIARIGFEVISMGANIGVFREISKHARIGDFEKVKATLQEQLSFIITMSLPLVCIIFLSKEDVAHLLLPSSHESYFVAVVTIIALGSFLINVKHAVFDNVFHSTLTNYRQIIPLLFGAISSITSGLFLVPNFGINGAATMYLCASLTSTVSSAIISRRIIRIKIQVAKILISISLGIGLTLLSQFILINVNEITLRICIYVVIYVFLIFSTHQVLKNT